MLNENQKPNKRDIEKAPPLFFQKIREAFQIVKHPPPLFFRVGLLLFGIGMLVVLIRFIKGLGYVTNMNDGYPWGIWIAFDVIIGTALGTGGFLMAILIYLFNKGEFHPLIRSAVMTSAFGYTIAGFSVLIDLGRWANFVNLLLPWHWNTNSVLFEVAICILCYTIVVWIELSPIFVEKAIDGNYTRYKWINNIVSNIQRHKNRWNRFLVVIVALGMILPILHQTSLGTLMVIARTKVHPLWYTQFLPLLFIVSIFFMGYSMVILENFASSYFMDREFETTMIKKFLPMITVVAVAWVILRITTLIYSGNVFEMFAKDVYTLYFLAEIVAAIVGIIAMFVSIFHFAPRYIYTSAILLLFAGSLYRFNVYLLAYNYESGYSYIPSIGETIGTFGFMSAEILAYLFFIKNLAILSDHKKQEVSKA